MSTSPIPVFILHWNQPEECERTVLSFLADSLPLDIRVVDNASNPSALAALEKALPKQVQLIRMKQNLGWGGAFNIVLQNWLANEESDFCIISAHDALPKELSLSMLISSMRADPQIGIACPEYGESVVPRFSKIHYVRITPVAPRPPGTVERVDMPNGTLMAFRRQCLRCFRFEHGARFELTAG